MIAFFVEQFIFYSILPDRKSSLGEQSLELGGGVRCVLVDWNKVLNILGGSSSKLMIFVIKSVIIVFIVTVIIIIIRSNEASKVVSW